MDDRNNWTKMPIIFFNEREKIIKENLLLQFLF